MSVILRPHVPPFAGTRAAPLDTSAPWEPAEGGGGVRVPTVRLSTGAFARALAALQRDSDPASGAFMTSVGLNVLRYETLASGGRLALVESAATTGAKNNRNRAGSGWNAGSSVVETSGQIGPDGVASAYREEVSSGGFSPWLTTVATSGPFVASQWIKRGGANTSKHAQAYNGAIFTHSESDTGLTAVWQRDVIRIATGTSGTYVPVDGRTGAVIAAGARDVVSDLVQLEAGRFATSAIINATGASLTRPADTLTWAAAPAALLSQRCGFDHVRPIFTSTLEVVNGDAFWLLSIGGASDGIVLRQASGILTIDAVVGGVTRAQSQPLATLADETLGSVVWDPAAGVIYVDGTPGPTGTPWTWSAGALRVGGIYGGAGEACCGLSDIY